VAAGRLRHASLRGLKIGELREPDHIAPTGWRGGAMVRPTAAIMARLLSGLSIFALESIAKTSGTISTKARRTGPAFSLAQSRHGFLIRPFFLTQGFPRHQKRLEEILRGHLCPHRVAKRTAFIVACTKIGRR
jgi:hypothetical protein